MLLLLSELCFFFAVYFHYYVFTFINVGTHTYMLTQTTTNVHTTHEQSKVAHVYKNFLIY